MDATTAQHSTAVTPMFPEAPSAPPKRSHKRKPGNAPRTARRVRAAEPDARDRAADQRLRELGADAPEIEDELEQHQGEQLAPLAPPRDPALVARDVANMIKAVSLGVVLLRARKTGTARPEIVDALGNVAEGVAQMASQRMPPHVGGHWALQLTGMLAEVAVAMISPALAALPAPQLEQVGG